MSGVFGATILTDCKNGSDKPSDNTIRLTLIRTPVLVALYDQGTQILTSRVHLRRRRHSGDWRQGGSDWQGQRLNDPLIAFQTSPHAGALGGSFFAAAQQPEDSPLA